MNTAISRYKIKTLIRVVCLVVCILSPLRVLADENVLTFFGWSDQHVRVDGDGAHLIGAIDAMNKLPGRAYPASITGQVDEPNFVMGLGDITEWPSRAARDTYERLITKRLRFRSFDVAGNHDSGGLSPSPAIHDWLIKRHGALSYTFDKKGVHFVAIYSKYDESLNNPAQPIAQATVTMYKGVNFVQLPSPAPDSAPEFTVIRIDSDRLVAIPFDYEKGQWCADPKRILDAKIRGPREKAQPRK